LSLYDIVGLFGVAAYIGAYALLQVDRLRSDDLRYLALNGVGSGLILVSLLGSFNLPSFVTQTLWLGFTIVGAFRALAKRRAAS